MTTMTVKNERQTRNERRQRVREMKRRWLSLMSGEMGEKLREKNLKERRRRRKEQKRTEWCELNEWWCD